MNNFLSGSCGARSPELSVQRLARSWAPGEQGPRVFSFQSHILARRLIQYDAVVSEHGFCCLVSWARILALTLPV